MINTCLTTPDSSLQFAPEPDFRWIAPLVGRLSKLGPPGKIAAHEAGRHWCGARRGTAGRRRGLGMRIRHGLRPPGLTSARRAAAGGLQPAATGEEPRLQGGGGAAMLGGQGGERIYSMVYEFHQVNRSRIYMSAPNGQINKIKLTIIIV